MQYSGIQGNFLTSGKIVKSLVIGLSSLYFLITANESISLLFFERKFCRKSKQTNSCRASVFRRNRNLGSKRGPQKGWHHSWFFKCFKDELLISFEIRPHLQLTRESKTFLCVGERGRDARWAGLEVDKCIFTCVGQMLVFLWVHTCDNIFLNPGNPLKVYKYIYFFPLNSYSEKRQYPDQVILKVNVSSISPTFFVLFLN